MYLPTSAAAIFTRQGSVAAAAVSAAAAAVAAAAEPTSLVASLAAETASPAASLTAAVAAAVSAIPAWRGSCAAVAVISSDSIRLLLCRSPTIYDILR